MLEDDIEENFVKGRWVTFPPFSLSLSLSLLRSCETFQRGSDGGRNRVEETLVQGNYMLMGVFTLCCFIFISNGNTIMPTFLSCILLEQDEQANVLTFPQWSGRTKE